MCIEVIVKLMEVHEMTEDESIKVEEGDGWTKSLGILLIFTKENPIRHTVVLLKNRVKKNIKIVP